MVMEHDQMSVGEKRVNLLDFDVEGIKQWCAEHGEKPFRAVQLLVGFHRYCVDDFDAMTRSCRKLSAK